MRFSGSLSPVPRGEGWGEGKGTQDRTDVGALKNVKTYNVRRAGAGRYCSFFTFYVFTFLGLSPLTPALSPEYRGEGEKSGA